MAATPGPWEVSTNGRGWDVCAVGAGDMIADLSGCDNAEANARLIAAAPALADALRRLLHQVDYMGAPADHPDMIAAREALTAAGVAEI